MDIQFYKVLVNSLEKVLDNLNNIAGCGLEVVNITNIIKSKTILEEVLNLVRLSDGKNNEVKTNNL